MRKEIGTFQVGSEKMEKKNVNWINLAIYLKCAASKLIIFSNRYFIVCELCVWTNTDQMDDKRKICRRIARQPYKMHRMENPFVIFICWSCFFFFFLFALVVPSISATLFMLFQMSPKNFSVWVSLCVCESLCFFAFVNCLWVHWIVAYQAVGKCATSTLIMCIKYCCTILMEKLSFNGEARHSSGENKCLSKNLQQFTKTLAVAKSS